MKEMLCCALKGQHRMIRGMGRMPGEWQSLEEGRRVAAAPAPFRNNTKRTAWSAASSRREEGAGGLDCRAAPGGKWACCRAGMASCPVMEERGRRMPWHEGISGAFHREMVERSILRLMDSLQFAGRVGRRSMPRGFHIALNPGRNGLGGRICH